MDCAHSRKLSPERRSGMIETEELSRPAIEDRETLLLLEEQLLAVFFADVGWEILCDDESTMISSICSDTMKKSQAVFFFL